MMIKKKTSMGARCFSTPHTHALNQHYLRIKAPLPHPTHVKQGKDVLG